MSADDELRLVKLTLDDWCAVCWSIRCRLEEYCKSARRHTFPLGNKYRTHHHEGIRELVRLRLMFPGGNTYRKSRKEMTALMPLGAGTKGGQA